jgi:PAS domain S-box-containing protein
MRENLRRSGIDIIGDVPWGTIFCQFYQTKEDLVDILVPYFRAGLENNEFCLWITSYPLEVKEAKEALRRVVPNLDTYLDNGQIEIRPSSWHIKDDVFDLQRAVNDWIEKTSHALASRYDGLRYSGNDLFGHEKILDSAIGKYPMMTLCTYFLDICNVTTIFDIISNHQFALIKREGKWEQIESSCQKNIRECKQTEKTLLESEEWYKAIFDNSLDGIILTIPDGTILAANPAACQMFRMTEEELIRAGRNGIVDTSDPRLKSILEERARTGRFKGELNYKRKDGTIFPSEISSTLFKDKNDLTKVVMIIRDITERKQLEEQTLLRAEEMEMIMEVVPTPILISHDPQGHNITGNRMANKFYGAEVGENISASIPKGGRFFYKGHELTASELPIQQAALKDIDLRNVELNVLLPSGKRRIIIVSASPLHNAEGHVRSSVGSFIDITELKETEARLKDTLNNLEEIVKTRTSELEKAYNSLKESEKSLAEAQKMAHIGNGDWNLVTGEIHWSDEMYHIFGLDPKESDVIYDELLNYVHPDDRDYVDNAFQRGLKGESFGIDYRIILANGEERTVHTQIKVIFDEKNTPVRMRGTLQDITERKTAEEKIQSLANIVESSNDAIGTLSLEGIITSWNEGAEQVYGYSAEEVLGKPISILAPSHLDEDTKKLSEGIQKGENIHQYETIRLKKDGKRIDVSINLSPVFDVSGNLTAISFVVRDITERKQAERFLTNIETARKKEIHHRIKNNLQVISSLLDLQAEMFRDRGCVEDSEVLSAFRESQDRVISIALIHEELHEGKGTDTLNFSPYLERLVNNLFQTYRLGNVNTSLNIELEEDIFFDMDIAVPLGIIINELVSNSLKYAFIGRDKGLIQIKLCRKESTECTNNGQGSKKEGYNGTNFTLTVLDNGIGILEDFNSEDSGSLGLQLVAILVDQLGGELELKRDTGTEFIIRFVVTEKNEQIEPNK